MRKNHDNIVNWCWMNGFWDRGDAAGCGILGGKRVAASVIHEANNKPPFNAQGTDKKTKQKQNRREQHLDAKLMF